VLLSILLAVTISLALIPSLLVLSNSSLTLLRTKLRQKFSVILKVRV